MKDTLSKEFRFGFVMAPIIITVGAVLIYLGLAIFLGSFGDAFTFIAFSVICTLGVSLILWIPACYVVGYIPVLVFRLLMRNSKKPGSAAQPTSSEKNVLQVLSTRLEAELSGGSTLTNDQRALIDYVENADRKGLSREQISLNLINNGWSTNSINWALDFVKSDGGV